MRAQTVNFERGQDPKGSMGVGVAHLIPKITSEDLELLQFGWDYDKNEWNDEEFIKEYSFDDDEPEFKAEQLAHAKKIALALKGKIKFNYKVFDWKEEEEMIEFINSNPEPKFPIPYNAHPGMDDWQIVWSKVPLPSAEIIIP